jgi:hypothetical protein
MGQTSEKLIDEEKPVFFKIFFADCFVVGGLSVTVEELMTTGRYRYSGEWWCQIEKRI